MEPFETVGPDGKVYLHYQNWERWRAERCTEYPCPPGKWRLDIEIAHPRNKLREVPVPLDEFERPRNPHARVLLNKLGGVDYDSYELFYVCDDWSTIFGVHDAHRYDTNGESYRFLVESGHEQPWGERVRLMSTSCYIVDPWWQKNYTNQFAFFRGKYWLVTFNGFLHDWPVQGFPPGCPIRDVRHTIDEETGRFFDNPFPSLWNRERNER